MLIFGVLRLMKYVNTKLDLRMDMVGEIYTIFYAVFPYKIMYLNLKSLLPGLILIAIKCIFKAVVFVIVPCLKRTSSKLAPREKSLKKQSGPEIQNLDESGQSIEQPMNRTVIAGHLDIDKKDQNTPQVDKSTKKVNIENSPEFQAKKKFLCNFLIYSLIDVGMNLSVLMVVLVTNWIFNQAIRNSHKFKKSLFGDVVSWSLIELAVDLVFFVWCLVLYQKYWFGGDTAERISYVFSSLIKQVCGIWIITLIAVGFLGYYILFFVVLKVSFPL